jgi:hypothetical protein
VRRRNFSEKKRQEEEETQLNRSLISEPRFLLSVLPDCKIELVMPPNQDAGHASVVTFIQY